MGIGYAPAGAPGMHETLSLPLSERLRAAVYEEGRPVSGVRRAGVSADGPRAGESLASAARPGALSGLRGSRDTGGKPLHALSRARPGPHGTGDPSGDERRNLATRVPGRWSLAYRITQRLLTLGIWP